MDLHKAISNCFGRPTVEEIFQELKATGRTGDSKESHWANSTLAALEKMSPTSLKIVHRQLIEGRKRDYSECFKMEYRMSQAFMKNKDFYEGVRALLVDKDKNPKWSPRTIGEVYDKDVDSYFQPIEKELQL
jgi:enoyl-CoA hydratase/carnithine racemase